MENKHYKIEDSDKLNALNESTANYQGSSLRYIQVARDGISVKALLQLGEAMAMSLQDLANILHVSLRTLQRYAPNKLLNPDASAKAIQLAGLRKQGIDVFADEESFNDWLRSGLPSLDGQRPIDFLDTPYGFRLLEQLLGRIEHGVFA